eukprot:8095730-Pyramimonas_sp.AAC.1
MDQGRDGRAALPALGNDPQGSFGDVHGAQEDQMGCDILLVCSHHGRCSTWMHGSHVLAPAGYDDALRRVCRLPA